MWSVVGDSLYKLTNAFFETGILPKGLNDTFLVLITKVQVPNLVTQLRPISLCNVAYKVITKAITNRIKRFLPGIIGPNQSRFVSGRQVLDNVVIYQEALNSMRKKTSKVGQMGIKIDLEKAYDRLSWDFI